MKQRGSPFGCAFRGRLPQSCVAGKILPVLTRSFDAVEGRASLSGDSAEMQDADSDMPVDGIWPLHWCSKTKTHTTDGLTARKVQHIVHFHSVRGDVEALRIGAHDVSLETLRLLAVHLPVLRLRTLVVRDPWNVEKQAAAAEIVAACTTVQHLSVYCGNNLFVDAIREHTGLTEIVFGESAELNNMSHIRLIDEVTARHRGVRLLDIREAHVRGESAAAIVRLLESGHGLKTLRLWDSSTTPDNLDVILRALRCNTTLHEFSTPRNNAYNTPASLYWPESIAAAIRTTFDVNVTLRKLSMNLWGIEKLMARNTARRDARVNRFMDAALVVLGLKRFHKARFMTYVAPQLIKFVVQLLQCARYDPAWDGPLPGIVEGKRQRVATKRMNLK